MLEQIPAAGFPLFPFTWDPDKTGTILGWVVTTEPDQSGGQPASVGVATSDPATWPEEYDGVEDILLGALRHADGRRVVINFQFIDD